MNIDKTRIALIEWFNFQGTGYNVTLNAMTKDPVHFEQDLRKLTHYLNNYCFGRAYRRNEKRLKIIAGLEKGQLDKRLHAHLVINNIDETNRTLPEINTYIRKHWYGLIGLKNTHGNMVDVKQTYDASGAIDYLTKDSQFMNRIGESNIILL